MNHKHLHPGDLVCYAPQPDRWYLARVYRQRAGFVELDYFWGARGEAVPEQLEHIEDWAQRLLRHGSISRGQLLEACYAGEPAYGERVMAEVLAVLNRCGVPLREEVEAVDLPSYTAPLMARAIA